MAKKVLNTTAVETSIQQAELKIKKLELFIDNQKKLLEIHKEQVALQQKALDSQYLTSEDE